VLRTTACWRRQSGEVVCCHAQRRHGWRCPNFLTRPGLRAAFCVPQPFNTPPSRTPFLSHREDVQRLEAVCTRRLFCSKPTRGNARMNCVSFRWVSACVFDESKQVFQRDAGAFRKWRASDVFHWAGGRSKAFLCGLNRPDRFAAGVPIAPLFHAPRSSAQKGDSHVGMASVG